MNEEKRKEREKKFIERANVVHNGKYINDDVHFVNNHTNISVICPTHGSFLILPKNYLRGQGCPICGKEKAKVCHKGNYKGFCINLVRKFGDSLSTPHIEQEYVNEHSIITLKCNSCGSIYHLEPNYVLSDKFNGCTECKYKITYQELLPFNKTENKIIPFEGQKDCRYDCVTMVCSVHGNYKARIMTVINGKGQCKRCNGFKRLMKEEEFKERLYNRFGETIKPISEYNGVMKKMTFQCENGHTFYRTPNTFLRGNLHLPCPICSKETLAKEYTKSKEQFISDAIQVYGDNKFDFTNTEYQRSDKYVTIKCNECGRYFTITANSFLRGYGCPYHYCNSSMKENEIKEFIESLGFECLTNSRNILPSGKELDIYIPSAKFAIEFDGLYWHNELNKEKYYHLSKTVECEKLGVRLMHIFEDEWVNKRGIISSMIMNYLWFVKENVELNKCVIKTVSKNEADVFLEVNHIQGTCNCSIRYGLFYNNELITLLAIRKIGSTSNEFEIVRLCNKINCCIKGSYNKLFKFFLNKFKPSNVIMTTDRRFCEDEAITELGFKQYKITEPSYYYVVGMERKSQSNFTKKLLVEKHNCPQDMTAHQFCASKKWYRIYDCGQKYYKWDNNES